MCANFRFKLILVGLLGFILSPFALADDAFLMAQIQVSLKACPGQEAPHAVVVSATPVAYKNQKYLISGLISKFGESEECFQILGSDVEPQLISHAASFGWSLFKLPQEWKGPAFDLESSGPLKEGVTLQLENGSALLAADLDSNRHHIPGLEYGAEVSLKASQLQSPAINKSFLFSAGAAIFQAKKLKGILSNQTVAILPGISAQILRDMDLATLPGYPGNYFRLVILNADIQKILEKQYLLNELEKLSPTEVEKTEDVTYHTTQWKVGDWRVKEKCSLDVPVELLIPLAKETKSVQSPLPSEMDFKIEDLIAAGAQPCGGGVDPYGIYCIGGGSSSIQKCEFEKETARGKPERVQFAYKKKDKRLVFKTIMDAQQLLALKQDSEWKISRVSQNYLDNVRPKVRFLRSLDLLKVAFREIEDAGFMTTKNLKRAKSLYELLDSDDASAVSVKDLHEICSQLSIEARGYDPSATRRQYFTPELGLTAGSIHHFVENQLAVIYQMMEGTQ